MRITRYGYRIADLGGNQVDHHPASDWPGILSLSIKPGQMLIYPYEAAGAIHRLKNRLADLMGEQPDNHETYVIDRPTGRLCLKFSDWHMYVTDSIGLYVRDKRYEPRVVGVEPDALGFGDPDPEAV